MHYIHKQVEQIRELSNCPVPNSIYLAEAAGAAKKAATRKRVGRLRGALYGAAKPDKTGYRSCVCVCRSSCDNFHPAT